VPSRGTSDAGRTIEKVGKATGQSKTTVLKQAAIVAAANAGNKIAQLGLKELDSDRGSVSAIYREITQRQPVLVLKSKTRILRETFEARFERLGLTASVTTAVCGGSTTKFDLRLSRLSLSQLEHLAKTLEAFAEKRA
jgi:hypothetical protein